MYNERESIGSKSRQNHAFKTSLGNRQARYNSEVLMQRRKYVISSTKNSEDAPDWMSRTQPHHFRENNKNHSIFNNAASPFAQVQQTYVYARMPKAANPEGQFERLGRGRGRSKWELHNHTFEFEWPRNEKGREGKCMSQLTMYESMTNRPSSRQNQISRIELPKYAYRESPLHVQKETPIKIGHPYMLNSTYVH